MLDCDVVCGGGGGLGSCTGTPISDIKSVMRFDLILKSKGLSLYVHVIHININIKYM